MGMLEIIDSLSIPDVKVVRPRIYMDERGFFSETYSREDFRRAGIQGEFVQDNHSMSVDRGTLRGLHFQIPPRAQAKLVRVTRGAVLDVAVDIRSGSPTWGCHVKLVLSAREWNQLYIPQGFAHGFITIEADTEVQYKVTNHYSPDHERGIIWNDPDINIDFGMDHGEIILSEKDRRYGLLKDMPNFF